MKTSLMFKIGIAGMLVSVLVPFVALIMSLFGNDSLSTWIGAHFDENLAMVAMFILVSMIVYPIVKRGRQKYLEDMLRRPH